MDCTNVSKEMEWNGKYQSTFPLANINIVSWNLISALPVTHIKGISYHSWKQKDLKAIVIDYFIIQGDGWGKGGCLMINM